MRLKELFTGLWSPQQQAQADALAEDLRNGGYAVGLEEGGEEGAGGGGVRTRYVALVLSLEPDEEEGAAPSFEDWVAFVRWMDGLVNGGKVRLSLAARRPLACADAHM